MMPALGIEPVFINQKPQPLTIGLFLTPKLRYQNPSKSMQVLIIFQIAILILIPGFHIYAVSTMKLFNK